ncbi:hypothetical protein I6E64_15265 [Bacteroides fragilis]|uniref:transposase n=1 Tax=Bacteroides TaxID=816 RepID=UPI001F387AA3|nr:MULTISPECIES: transposase [Bacteroides]MCF2690402.1 hypothetical protein [Bacteroides fragilis]MCY6342079.1 hypothetical protein [Bacteroides fragilis]MCZ2671009.1 hypothetical protein [Bacteroides fragilis]MDV6205537.1 hypothetical protein [Bacteroides hominis (ex Liu et al. 2022)]
MYSSSDFEKLWFLYKTEGEPKGIQTRDGLDIRKNNLDYFGLKNFYYLPTFHDMRCKAPRVSEIIRSRYYRDPLQGDVYIFMSKKGHGSRRITYPNINAIILRGRS